MSSTEELEAFVGELQKKFDRLKVLYEQYFMGIEKIEPLTARKELARGVMGFQGVYVRSTGVRFKIASLIQKWNIYQSYWNRTMREIEQGRYVRHVAAARRRALQAGVEFPEEMALNVPAAALRDLAATLPDNYKPTAEEEPAPPSPPAPPSLSSGPAALPPPPPARSASGANAQARPASGVNAQPGSQRSVPPPLPPEVRPPARPVSGSAPAVPGYSEESLRELHRRVVSAQRSAGEATEMRFETLVSQLSRQVPKLITEHGCKAVAFDVVTRDGKVKLKPSPVR